ncbi:MAG: pseudaminic acid biosynthesis-associated methylase [Candidatus Omnitrophota bacterium]
MATGKTEQMAQWQGDFGKQYTDRNTMPYEEFENFYVKRFGLTRTAINQGFLGSMDRNIRILEVGANTGSQLACLQRMGFTNLYGIELQQGAVEKAHELTRGIQLIQGTAFDIPFKDGFFDLVFTSGVLIHIAPADLPNALKEICRCSRDLIWGFEYWAKEMTEVKYRGHNSLLWKGDYAAEYRKVCKGLALVKEEKFRYLEEPLDDSMFLLKKG